ncbi:unnamed protein product [Urochloa humidicola]
MARSRAQPAPVEREGAVVGRVSPAGAQPSVVACAPGCASPASAWPPPSSSRVTPPLASACAIGFGGRPRRVAPRPPARGHASAEEKKALPVVVLLVCVPPTKFSRCEPSFPRRSKNLASASPDLTRRPAGMPIRAVALSRCYWRRARPRGTLEGDDHQSTTADLFVRPICISSLLFLPVAEEERTLSCCFREEQRKENMEKLKTRVINKSANLEWKKELMVSILNPADTVTLVSSCTEMDNISTKCDILLGRSSGAILPLYP